MLAYCLNVGLTDAFRAINRRIDKINEARRAPTSGKETDHD